jgi:hypothetical protein
MKESYDFPLFFKLRNSKYGKDVTAIDIALDNNQITAA